MQRAEAGVPKWGDSDASALIGNALTHQHQDSSTSPTNADRSRHRRAEQAARPPENTD